MSRPRGSTHALYPAVTGQLDGQQFFERSLHGHVARRRECLVFALRFLCPWVSSSVVHIRRPGCLRCRAASPDGWAPWPGGSVAECRKNPHHSRCLAAPYRWGVAPSRRPSCFGRFGHFPGTHRLAAWLGWSSRRTCSDTCRAHLRSHRAPPFVKSSTMSLPTMHGCVATSSMNEARSASTCPFSSTESSYLTGALSVTR